MVGMPPLTLTVPGALLSLGLLFVSVRRLVRAGQALGPAHATLASLPLVGEQTTTLPDLPTVSLWTEGPLFSTKFLGLTARLVDARGNEVPAHRVWIGPKTRTFTKARREWMRFDLRGPGSYRLAVDGLGPAPETTTCRLLVTPTPAAGEQVTRVVQLVAAILLTIVAFGGFIVGVVFSALRLAGK